MSFMTPQYYETDYYSVDTNIGTEIVPCDVCNDGTKLSDYVEGNVIYLTGTKRKHGWVGRLSASGYMDCTEWIAASSMEGIKTLLTELYGE